MLLIKKTYHYKILKCIIVPGRFLVPTYLQVTTYLNKKKTPDSYIIIDQLSTPVSTSILIYYMPYGINTRYNYMA